MNTIVAVVHPNFECQLTSVKLGGMVEMGKWDCGLDLGPVEQGVERVD